MSLLRKAVREQRATTLAATLTALGLDTRAGGKSTLNVSNDRALRMSATWACVNLTANTVAGIDFAAYRKTNDNPTRLPSQPKILTDPSPSPSVTAVDWKRQIVASWLKDGNAFGEVVEIGRNGWPDRVETIDPCRITYREHDGMVEWRLDNKDIKAWPLGPLWHAPGLVMAGCPIGLSVIEYARLTIALGAAAEEFGADWFKDGAHPSALLKSDQVVDSDAAKTAKDRFIAAVSGREPVVLGKGLEYQPIQTTANESQFLDTIKANTEDIARFFFPSFVLNVGNAQITYQNVEQRSLNLLTFDLDPWIVKLEHALGGLLPGGATGQYVQAHRAQLLRTDAKTRWEINRIKLLLGTNNRNEVRRDEGEGPIAGGDEYLWPPAASAGSATSNG